MKLFLVSWGHRITFKKKKETYEMNRRIVEFSYLLVCFLVFLSLMFYSFYNLALKMKKTKPCMEKWSSLYLFFRSNFNTIFCKSWVIPSNKYNIFFLLVLHLCNDRRYSHIIVLRRLVAVQKYINFIGSISIVFVYTDKLTVYTAFQ